MCLEILAREGNWTISYVPGAKCLTDPPITLKSLMKQRRRWHNGTIFATYYVLRNLGRIICGKGCHKALCRNILFFVLYLYMLTTTAISYVLIGLFYSSFSIFVREVYPDRDGLNLESAYVLENIYLTFISLLVLLSITIKLDWAEQGFSVISFLMGITVFFMVLSIIIRSLQREIDFLTYLFLITFACLVFLPILLNIKRVKIGAFIKGTIYTIFLSPTYVNTLTIYAICNIHDVSWGSRPDNKNKKIDPRFVKAEKKRETEFSNYRANFLVLWSIINIIVSNLVTHSSRMGQKTAVIAIGILLTIVVGFKYVFCTIYMFLS